MRGGLYTKLAEPWDERRDEVADLGMRDQCARGLNTLGQPAESKISKASCSIEWMYRARSIDPRSGERVDFSINTDRSTRFSVYFALDWRMHF
jgi:hypothetical protein